MHRLAIKKFHFYNRATRKRVETNWSSGNNQRNNRRKFPRTEDNYESVLEVNKFSESSA